MNKILEQLEKERENALSHQYDNESSEGYLAGINKAIEIVKNLNIPDVMVRSEQLFCKCTQPSDRSDNEIDRNCFNCGNPIAK